MSSRYILMLEPDPHDREITHEFFEKNNRDIRVEFLSYSHEVIPFLRSASSLPTLILLRFNAIPETGLHVLRAIKANVSFQHLPVIILGESTPADAVTQCYAAGASTFINKPFTFELADAKISSFIKYWFDVAELPVEEQQASVA
jgi:CheY-like chemotaxis protein